MYINWDVEVPGPGGIPVPTYGNYGGPGYSAGEVLASPNQPVDYDKAPPRDALDALFELHDQAYDSPSLLVRAQGDLALLQGISQLLGTQLDPEARAYAGMASLFAIQQIAVVNKHPELLSAEDALQYTRVALSNVEQGLAGLGPSERAELLNWFQEAAHAAGGTSTEAVLDLLGSVDLHGFDAYIGNLHGADATPVDAVVDALTHLYAADAGAFTFRSAAEALGLPSSSTISSANAIVEHAATLLTDLHHATGHSTATPTEEALIGMIQHHWPAVDYLLT